MSAKNVGIPFSDGMLITGEFTNATNQTGLNTDILRHGTRHAMRNGEEITIATPAPHVFPRGTTMPGFPIVINGSSVVINNYYNNVDQTSQNETTQVQENDRNREREYRRPAERSPDPFQSDIVLDPYRSTTYLGQPDRSHRNAFDRNERAHKPSVTWFVPMGASAAPTKIQPDTVHNPASVITLKEPNHVPPKEHDTPEYPEPDAPEDPTYEDERNVPPTDPDGAAATPADPLPVAPQTAFPIVKEKSSEPPEPPIADGIAIPGPTHVYEPLPLPNPNVKQSQNGFFKSAKSLWTSMTSKTPKSVVKQKRKTGKTTDETVEKKQPEQKEILKKPSEKKKENWFLKKFEKEKEKVQKISNNAKQKKDKVLKKVKNEGKKITKFFKKK
jgi:hypothetical protein